MGEKAQCAKEHSVSTRLTRWNFCGARNGLCGISCMCSPYISLLIVAMKILWKGHNSGLKWNKKKWLSWRYDNERSRWIKKRNILHILVQLFILSCVLCVYFLANTIKLFIFFMSNVAPFPSFLPFFHTFFLICVFSPLFFFFFFFFFLKRE